MKFILTFLFLLLSAEVFSQGRNSVWCFGDSAGIDFNDPLNPVPISTGMDGRGSCVSISNTSGELLFYGNTRNLPTVGIHTTVLYDSTHTIMQNGDSITGRSWYQELVIIPDPKNDSTYYLFTVGVTTVFGLYYSKIDMKLNNGLGSVIEKNIQLNFLEQTDCITAVKHGNGRDWWLITRKSDYSTGASNNDWYIYLITSDTIQALPIQSIGQQNRTNTGKICFSPEGNKLAFTNLLNVLEIFDFDRCSGTLSNAIIIETDPGFAPYPMNWNSAFSSNASKLYVSTNDTVCYLFQYDLNSSNISGSKDTVWSTNFPFYTLGGVALAPDNKIYISNQFYDGFNSPYPYPDSVYNIYNMNLSVINFPDSLGTNCNFQPYSFYLGGKRAYKGLPNNPDYDLGPLVGSPCDTIVSIPELEPQPTTSNLYIYYSPQWQSAFINADKLKGKTYQLRVLDAMGREVHSETGKLSSTYFTGNLNCEGFAKGMYVVNFVTDKERLTKRFVVN